MTRTHALAGALAAALLSSPVTAQAPTFTVQKYDIGGTGGTDYLVAEPGTGRVFISRQTHVMVVDANTGKVLGDIPDTPRMHGIGLASKYNHGFTTNAGDSSLTMFDLKTLAFIKKIPVKVGGLDGIMYDETSDRIILTNHSKPGTAVAVNAETGEITGTAKLEDDGPEGAAVNGKGWIYINLEGKNTIQVIDAKTMASVASWPIEACDGPTGIAYDAPSDRVFSGCGKTSVVVDGTSGKIVAKIKNGDGVDALGYDPTEKLIYIPSGRGGNVTVVHQDSPDTYTVVATVPTVPGAKTIAVDPVTHRAFVFQPQRGPATPPPAGSPAGTRPTPGPITSAMFVVISH
jgi:DNA-binding beta-propeller fold protein YncE